MITLRRLFLWSLVFALSSCAVLGVEPDKDLIDKLNPATAKSILLSHCPTCGDSTVKLSCENRYVIDQDNTKTTIDYPYHDLAMICGMSSVEIMGRQTDCVSSWKEEKLPRVELTADDTRQLCNAAFAVINNYRVQEGLERWGYYEQKAEPEK